MKGIAEGTYKTKHAEAAKLPAPRQHLQYPVQLVKRLSTQSARRESLQLGEGKLF